MFTVKSWLDSNVRDEVLCVVRDLVNVLLSVLKEKSMTVWQYSERGYKTLTIFKIFECRNRKLSGY